MDGIFRRCRFFSERLFRTAFPPRSDKAGREITRNDCVERHYRSPGNCTTRRWPAAFAAAAFAGAWGGTALAGGYVVPLLNAAPSAPAVTAGAPQNWWMALIPLFLLALASRGGGRGDNDLTPVPTDYGGPCFGERTLIWLERGWVPVEEIRADDRIVTSRGIQTVLAVESWQPVEYRDRPAVFENVRLSPNHGIKVGNIIVPACNLTAVRTRIDGSRYFHILVRDHSWLFAKAHAEGTIIRAESLCMTADLKLARTFPDLVARHARYPVAEIRVDPKDPTARSVA